MPAMTILGIVLPCCFISISYISIYWRVRFTGISISYISIYWRVRSTGISISYISIYTRGLDLQVYPYPIYPYI